MIKKIYLLLTISLLLLLPLSILKISAMEEIYPRFKINLLKEQPIGNLRIDKINLNEDLYDISSNKNNIEEHVTILKESSFPNLLILAAHSGEGHIAYFEELDKLKVDDEIKLTYNKHKYLYIIKSIWEEKKNGYININKENKNQLILTTCSPNKDNYQLIINCIEKESN